MGFDWNICDWGCNWNGSSYIYRCWRQIGTMRFCSYWLYQSERFSSHPNLSFNDFALHHPVSRHYLSSFQVEQSNARFWGRNNEGVYNTIRSGSLESYSSKVSANLIWYNTITRKYPYNKWTRFQYIFPFTAYLGHCMH